MSKMTSQKCRRCNRDVFHNEQWDAMFCLICNTWNEDSCDSSECTYCVDRPERPFEAHIDSVLKNIIRKGGR